MLRLVSPSLALSLQPSSSSPSSSFRFFSHDDTPGVTIAREVFRKIGRTSCFSCPTSVALIPPLGGECSGDGGGGSNSGGNDDGGGGRDVGDISDFPSSPLSSLSLPFLSLSRFLCCSFPVVLPSLLSLFCAVFFLRLPWLRLLLLLLLPLLCHVLASSAARMYQTRMFPRLPRTLRWLLGLYRLRLHIAPYPRSLVARCLLSYSGT